MDSPDLATPATGRTPAVPRSRILTWPLIMVFLSTFGAGMSFCLLLSVVPLYASSIGAGGLGAGLTTGVLMASTVVAELCTPRLAARFGHRAVMATGLVLLGVPALALPGSTSTATVMAVCAVRGAGFAVSVVLSGALVAALVPPERRGEGLGLYGVVVGVPAVVALPLGVWLAGEIGYPPVFVAGALAALAGLAAVPALPGRAPRPGPRAPVPGRSPAPARDQAAAPAAAPGRPPAPEHGQTPAQRALGQAPAQQTYGQAPAQHTYGQAPAQRALGVLAGFRTPALVRPSIVFAATAMASGTVVTFLPVAVPPGSGDLAAVALLTQAAASTLTRWWAGWHADRHGTGRLLAPGVLMAAAGMTGLVFTTAPAAVVAGMALFGAGFGIAQNASLTMMFERAPASAYGTVSAVWNLAYDAGLGLGAVAAGVLAVRTGYPFAFALTAALVPIALVLARPRPHR
ncbi:MULTISPECIES: MFS transporter [Streptosporangium]|uniref:MFS family arabinose efflux permease n=1 Tax=Streptosporangium brasiliense TaxID=47480 RepID=A0ABT9R644_9ACTN|nr:MFS transporter [Streptosporangium brasiliense]MDP9864703.1 putative MFS family arabinose efflux permease [Streptosporangium brasiliense]